MGIIQVSDKVVHKDDVYFMVSDMQPYIVIVYVNGEEVVRFVPTIMPKQGYKIVDMVFNLLEQYGHPIEKHTILKQLNKERRGE